MASTINYGNEYKTRIGKGFIKKDEYVTVSHPGDYETHCKVTDEQGNEEEYLMEELMGFGYIKGSGGIFDIIEDYSNGEDELGNKKVLKGLIHYTPNVRSGQITFRVPDDSLYMDKLNKDFRCYQYHYKNLTDKEVIEIILNEIVYGVQPDLQSISLVGTTKKGIDKDPNYHDGHYILSNNKEYTVTWCGGVIKIREGNDGGWYHDKAKAGRELYNGKMDWDRYKVAKINKAAVQLLRKGQMLFDQYPEIATILFNDIKNDDIFKLSNEF